MLGYACFYKYNTEKADKILDAYITISLVRENKFRKLIKQLSQKYEVIKKSAGIYHVEKMLFLLQILVTKESGSGVHTWLRSLARFLEHKEADNLLSSYDKLENSRDKLNANVVVDFVSNLNKTIFICV